MNITKDDKSYIIKEDDCTIHLDIQNDDMELWCSIEPKKPNINFSYTDFKTLVKEELKFFGHRERDEIRNIVAQAKLGKEVKNAIIMKGIPSENGENGKLEFYFQPTKEGPDFSQKDAKDDNIDYHNLHLFDNVKRGEAIAKIHPPQRGTPGTTLLGEKHPATDGEALRLSFGEGVRMGSEITPGEAKDSIYAKINGRIEWNEQASFISITDKYIVKDVGFNTGDIDFIGDVEVNGDVIDTYNIKTGGNLFIKGNIEGSQIEAGGNLTFSGITGKDIATIKCGGLITAKFIDGTKVEALGDVLVKNEIVDSDIKTRGKVVLEKKAIIGGSVLALTGIESKNLGSDIGVKTILCAGKCYRSQKEIKNIKETIEQNAIRLEEISKFMNPLIADPKQVKRLTKDQKMELRKTAAEFTDLNRKQTELPGKIEEIRNDVKKKANPVINVLGTLHRGVDINLGSTIKQITTDEKKSMSIVENSRKKDLRFLPMVPLTENAILVEKQISRAEIEAERAGS